MELYICLRRTIGPNNIRDPLTGFTCLHHAALNGHAECVKLILADGAKLNAVDYKGSSALHLAAWSGNSEVVEILLDCNQSTGGGGGRFGSPSTSTSSPPSSSSPPLAESCSVGKLSSTVTASGINSHQQVDIDLCNNDNQTPLSLAAQFGHNKVVELLLSRSANVHIRNSRLESALDLACLNGKLETVRLILDSSPSLVADLKRPYATFAVNQPTTTHILARLNNDQSVTTSERGQDHSTIQPHRRGSTGWASVLLRSSSGLGNSRASSQNAGSESKLILKTESHLSSINVSPLRRATLAAATSEQSPSTSSSIKRGRRLLGVKDSINRATSGSLDDGGFVGHGFCVASVENYQQQQTSLRRHQFSRQQILLDHSPLHYAVRRGHLNVVNLLLNEYKANIMQLTTLGSVLHEVVLSSCKSSSINDIVNLLFAHIGMAESIPNLAESQSYNSSNNIIVDPDSTKSTKLFRLKLLDEFLGSKNSHQQTALNVLDQINNRSAHEIKRLIYDYSDRIRQQETMQSDDQMKHDFGSTLINKENENLTNLVQPTNQVIANKQSLSSRQQQQFYNSNESSSSQQNTARQFSEQQHLNSFVTMKRVPKNQQVVQQPSTIEQAYNRPKDQILNDIANIKSCTGNDIVIAQQQQQEQPYPLHTQTIGRCRPQYKQTIGQTFVNINSPHQFMNNTNLYNDQRVTDDFVTRHPAIGSYQHQQNVSINNPKNYGNCSQQQQQQIPIITRSVSNLSRVPMNYYDDPNHFCSTHTGANSSNLELNSQPTSGISDLGGSSSTSGYYTTQTGEALEPDRTVRKRRSRSRDLGSLLMEAAHLRAMNSVQQQQYPLYGNEREIGSSSSAMAASNHLVRSQTDCSHLMGRFVQSSDHQLSDADGRFCQDVPAAKMMQQQPYCSATLDRKMINRRYHVYEHEFYPPRLLPGANPAAATGVQVSQQHQFAFQTSKHETAQNRAAIAIVPPLATCSMEGCSTTGSDSFSSSAHQLTNDDRQMQHNRQIDRFLTRQLRKCPPTASINDEQQAARTPVKFTDRAKRFDGSCKTGDIVPSNTSRTDALWEDACGKSDENNHLPPAYELSQMENNNIQQMFSDTRHIHLESRLSNESHLFESTQQALMRDFDLMIGRELLNGRNEKPSRLPSPAFASFSTAAIKPNRQQQQQQRPSSATQATILTGVSLDMDHYGERLTVSGTLTLPTESRAKQQQQHIHDDSKSSRQPVIDSMKRSVNLQSARASTSFELDSSVQAIGSKSKPEKPPRPSLASSTKFQQMRNKQQQFSLNQNTSISAITANVIYDQPAMNNKITDSRRQQQSTNGRNVPVVPNLKASSVQSRASVTQPPRERPPPPPPLPPVTVPREINDGSHDHCIASSDGTLVQQRSSLIKEITNNSSEGSSNAISSIQLSHHLATSVSGGADADSGVCTSNSPASLSHNSDELLNIKSEEQMMNPLTLSSRSSVTETRPFRMELIGSERGNSNLVPPIAPPSPATAQTCIEDALKPLEQTTHVSINCQTMSPSQFSNYNNCHGFEQLSSSAILRKRKSATDIVDRWLSGDSTMYTDGEVVGIDENHSAIVDYENCKQLQQQLAKTYRRSKSLNNLLLTHQKWSKNNSKKKETRDDDYANCSSTSSKCTTNSSTESCANVYHSNDSCSSSSCAVANNDPHQRPMNKTNTQQLNEGEKIILKVVVDKHEQVVSAAKVDNGNEGDEVFYINPIELKKISSKSQRRRNGSTSQCDAETLTDEELFATVDKDSGFIRFTLRKRRAVTDSNEIMPVINYQMKTEQKNKTNAERRIVSNDETRSNSQHTGSVPKKTKLISSGNDCKSDLEKEKSQQSCPISSGSSEIKKPIDLVSTQVRRVSEGPVPMCRITRQISDAADVEMNTSQSTGQGTSSSSSKESIQSVVSLQKPEVLDAKSTIEHTQESQAKEGEDTTKLESIESSDKVETSQGRQIDETERQLYSTTTTTKASANESMVCRAARELEAAMLKNQASSCLTGKPTTLTLDRKQPVAAIRRFVATRQQSQTSHEECSKSEKESIGPSEQDDHKDQAKKTSRQVVVRTVIQSETRIDAGKAGPVKAVRWPPMSDENKPDYVEPNKDIEPVVLGVGKLSANRLSFKKMIEERAGNALRDVPQNISGRPMSCVTNLIGNNINYNNGSISNSNDQRPRPPCGTKPLPPAKPAKLVAAAYVNAIQQK